MLQEKCNPAVAHVLRFVCRMSCGRERGCTDHLARRSSAYTRRYARVHAHKHVSNAPLFTRIPFSIDPLCAKSGIVRSWLPALLGLFIRLPVAATLFKASQDSCPAFILHRLSLFWSRLLSSLSLSLSLSLSIYFLFLS